MPELMSALRRLLGRVSGSGATRPADPLDAIPAVVDGATAVAITEAFVSEAAGIGPVTPGREAGARAFEERALRDRANLLGAATRGVPAADPRAALATAVGLSMSGLRATAFVGSGAIEAARDQIELAVGRHLPLVVHLACRAPDGTGAAAGSGHEAYHALAGTGAVQLFATNAQEAIDLTLLARRVAERALVPVVVAMDWEQTARSPQDVLLPSAELVSHYLGAPDDSIDSPTPAQEVIFGDRRRRVPRWYDLERPALHGARLEGQVFGLVAAAQRPFFREHVPGILRGAVAALAPLTGRRPSLLAEHRLRDAGVILVAQGAAFETAAAVADHVRASAGTRVGVVGVRALRPLPGPRLAEVLGRARTVVVLERADAPLSDDPPLVHELLGVAHRAIENARLGDETHPAYPSWNRRRFPRFRTVVYGLGGHPLRAGDLASVCGDGPSPTYLGVSVAPGTSPHPTRQALLDRLRRDYPDLDRLEQRAAEPLALRPDESFVAAIGRGADRGDEAIARIVAGVAHAALGGHVRGRTDDSGERWGGAAVDRIAFADSSGWDPGDEALADIALVCDPVASVAKAVRDGGALLLESEGGLPDREIRAARERGLAVHISHPVDGESAEHRRERRAGALLGALAARGALEVSARKLASARKQLLEALPDDERAARVEAFVAGFDDVTEGRLAEEDRASTGRRPRPAAIEHLRPRRREVEGAVDSLPRFWGQVGAPYEDGGAAALSADPYLATGLVPPLSSALRESHGQPALLPAFDADRCTGCGRCWSLCPDAAIAPVALGPDRLFEAGMALAKRAGDDATALVPMVSKLAPRVNKRVRGDVAPGAAGALLRESCSDALARAPLPDERKQGLLAAFDAALAPIEDLPLARTEPFFDAAESTQSGTGELLSLAFDPDACKGCGVCVAACDDEALRAEPPAPERVAAARAGWERWQRLPDTRGETIARVREHIGELPALLLSRHCALPLSRGDGLEPGSGARTDLRLALAAAEYQLQRDLAARIEDVAELRRRVGARIEELMTGALPADDLERLAHGLGNTGRGAISVAELTAGADSSGVDVTRMRRLVGAARELEDLHGRMTEGPFGLGRSRLGMVLAPDALTRALGVFPYNPLQIPAVIDHSGEAAALSRGLLEGQIQQLAGELALTRRARLELDSPMEARLAAAELARRGWDELSPAERAACPPILLVGGSTSFGERALSGLLAADLPIKVIVLADAAADLEADRWPGLGALAFALANPNAFVLQGSLADLDQLGAGLVRAFAHPGPALLHLHAPSPERHGFAADRGFAQAELATATRAFPQFVFDPDAEGVFGTHLSLAGNPDADRGWATDAGGVAMTPADWLVTESRFAAHFAPVAADAPSPTPLADYLELSAKAREGKTPIVTVPGETRAVTTAVVALCERRRRQWRVLQELAGSVTPFTERVRAEARAEVADAHADELAELRRRHEREVAELRDAIGADMTRRLEQRLLVLAGYGENGHPEEPS